MSKVEGDWGGLEIGLGLEEENFICPDGMVSGAAGESAIKSLLLSGNWNYSALRWYTSLPFRETVSKSLSQRF